MCGALVRAGGPPALGTSQSTRRESRPSFEGLVHCVPRLNGHRNQKKYLRDQTKSYLSTRYQLILSATKGVEGVRLNTEAKGAMNTIEAGIKQACQHSFTS